MKNHLPDDVREWWEYGLLFSYQAWPMPATNASQPYLLYDLHTDEERTYERYESLLGLYNAMGRKGWSIDRSTTGTLTTSAADSILKKYIDKLPGATQLDITYSFYTLKRRHIIID